MKEYIFKSKRLGFRNWLDEDAEHYGKMNADPVVMEYFPRTYSIEHTREKVQQAKLHFEKHTYGPYAVDLLENGEFIGYIGFVHPDFEADFMPCLEIGWRLKKEVWNKGYATEGAKKCLEYFFENFEIDSIVSFTAILNKKSERIMQKIGMTKIGEFDHPKIDTGHALERHVLYQISRNEL